MSREVRFLAFGAITVLVAALIVKWISGSRDPAEQISGAVSRAGGKAGETAEAGLAKVQEGIGAATEAAHAVVEGDLAGQAKEAVRRVKSSS